MFYLVAGHVAKFGFIDTMRAELLYPNLNLFWNDDDHHTNLTTLTVLPLCVCAQLTYPTPRVAISPFNAGLIFHKAYHFQSHGHNIVVHYLPVRNIPFLFAFFLFLSFFLLPQGRPSLSCVHTGGSE